MALPSTTINALLRQDYVPGMTALWPKADYAMAAYFFKHMEGFNSNRIKVDVDYKTISVGTHVGNVDNLSPADIEFATQGEQIAYLWHDVVRFNHTELLNMNTKADVRRIMSRKMDNLMKGTREKWVQHFFTLSASSSQWLRAYDIIDAYSSALHGITPSDLPSATLWGAQYFSGATYSASTRDALMNEGQPSYLPSIIRRLISKCGRYAEDSSDMKVYVSGYHWDLLNDLIDSKKIGSLRRENDAYLGIPNIWMDTVGIVKDNWLSYPQTSANAGSDGRIYLVNHKYTKMRANKKAMFTLIEGMIPAQTNTGKVSHVGFYGNFTCEKRNANGWCHTIYSEYNYN